MAAKNNETKNMKTASKEDRDKALNEALAQIQKQFGKGAVMKLGDDSARMNIEAISTGSMSLDLATGIGGVPKGRIIEVFGPESSGKTTLTLHIIAEAQKQGGRAAFIDAEHALDPESMWTNFSFHSRITVNRLSRSQRCSSGAALWRSW